MKLCRAIFRFILAWAYMVMLRVCTLFTEGASPDGISRRVNNLPLTAKQLLFHSIDKFDNRALHLNMHLMPAPLWQDRGTKRIRCSLSLRTKPNVTSPKQAHRVQACRLDSC